MRNISLCLLFVLVAGGLGSAAHAATFAVGEVAVVEDTNGAIHANVDLDNMQIGLMAPGGRFCRDTAQPFIAQFGDNYDGIFTFTPKMLDDLMNVQQGQPVRWSTQGIGTQPVNWGSQFGSAARLAQCVFMGSLGRLPAQPDGPATALLGLPLGITGTELMGHEYGHHWLVWAHYDKNDGRGRQDMLRGYEEDSNNPGMGQLNGHFGYHVDSRSVMYGNFITDNMNGTFSLTGGARKYGQLDQYLMGLRGANETASTMLLDDGSHHSSAAGAHGPTGVTTVNNMTRVDVTVDDVIRAEGPRVPAYPSAQSCFRVAFVLTVPPGQVYNPADVAKVDAYRRRWEQWFSWATDGRGTMDARLTGAPGCVKVPPPTDGGVVDPPPTDGGTEPSMGDVPYLTVPFIDDSPLLTEPPAQKPPTKEETMVDLGNTKLRPGCLCGAGAEGFMALAAVSLLLRRRRRS